MASRELFSSSNAAARMAPPTDTINEAGGKAYAFSDEHALAQYALTGTLNATFYASAETQLEKLLAFAGKVEPLFVAKLAIYAREHGHMKDTPALLLAFLAKRDIGLCAAVFPRVVDNAKMLRNFVQIVRSGAIGRKSLGTRPKALVRDWLLSRTPEALFRQSVGTDPSLADIVKMVHPTPKDDAMRAFFGWLLGKAHNAEHIPEIVRAFEAYKANPLGAPPAVPWEMLTALPLGKAQWSAIARTATWTQARMNLNTFARHGVFEDTAAILAIAEKLADPEEIARAKAFPYQLLAAYLNATDVPLPIRLALQAALEIATANVPTFPGKVCVFPDVSGSMSSPVTGARKGATSKVRCIDVAALIAATVLRRNPLATVLPFADAVIHPSRFMLNPLDTIVTNAEKLAAIGGGGTNCAAPLAALNYDKVHADLLIYVSDNQSWVDASPASRASGVMIEWAKIRARCPNAKLVCVDIQPNASTQAPEHTSEVLNVGGFSDRVFDVIADFAAGGENDLTARIQAVVL